MDIRKDHLRTQQHGVLGRAVDWIEIRLWQGATNSSLQTVLGSTDAGKRRRRPIHFFNNVREFESYMKSIY